MADEVSKSSTVPLRALTANVEASALRNETANDEEWKPRREHWMVLATITLNNFITTLDLTILSAALAPISASIGGSVNAIYWAPIAMLLANAVVQPFVGALSDILGRRPVYLASLTFFTIGTIISAVAQNIATLLAGRTIQGIGAGGSVCMAFIVMTDVYPRRQLSKYQSINWLFLSIATALGPVIGSLFAQHTTWRWIFYFNFPFIAAGYVMIILSIRFHTKRETLRSKIKRIDWFGGFLFTASLSSFLVALTWGGSEFHWGSYHTVVPLVLGLVGLIVSILWEKYFAKEPFLRLRLFNNRTALAAYACTFLIALIYITVLFSIPLYLQSVRGFSPSHSSLYLLILTAIQLPAVVCVGILMNRWGTYRWAIMAAATIYVISVGCMIHLSPTTTTAEWLLELLVFGAGGGSCVVALNNASQAAAVAQGTTSSADSTHGREQDRSYASNMYSFIRALGFTVGLALGSTMLQNFLYHHLLHSKGHVVSSAQAKQISLNAASFVETTMKQLPANGVLKTAIVDAYAAAFRNIFEVLTAVAALALIMTLLLKEYGMDAKLVGGDYSGHRLQLGNKAVNQGNEG